MPGARLKREYPHVTTFAGWQSPEEVARLYNQSRCLLTTTNYREMGPRIILEAAACNIPVVCCDDSPAAVSHVWRVGGFVAKPDPDDLAKKILLATNTIVNTREQLVRLGYTYDFTFRAIRDILLHEGILSSDEYVSRF